MFVWEGTSLCSLVFMIMVKSSGFLVITQVLCHYCYTLFKMACIYPCNARWHHKVHLGLCFSIVLFKIWKSGSPYLYASSYWVRWQPSFHFKTEEDPIPGKPALFLYFMPTASLNCVMAPIAYIIHHFSYIYWKVYECKLRSVLVPV